MGILDKVKGAFGIDEEEFDDDELMEEEEETGLLLDRYCLET